MGTTEDTDSAAARLAQLQRFFREHPVTGPVERAAPSTGAAAPMNIGMLDHIHRSVTEVAELTREVNPDAEPIPQEVQDLYAWCRRNTENADDFQKQRRQALEFRHYLEHAVRAGDSKVVRPLRCPGCGLIGGLLWRSELWRALCVNVYCARENGGVTQAWTLRQLAYEHVTAERMLRECAT